MANSDATIIIDGGIVTDPRWGTPNGNRVGNLTVRAGRSRKNDQGGYDQLSSTPYDVACWNEVHDLLAAQSPETGSQVRITGTVTGVNTYTDRDGNTQASVVVRAEGVKVWPKNDRQQSQQSYSQQPSAPSRDADPWAGGSGGGYDQGPPF